jgi:hypothetical protein
MPRLVLPTGVLGVAGFHFLEQQHHSIEVPQLSALDDEYPGDSGGGLQCDQPVGERGQADQLGSRWQPSARPI